MKSQSIMRKSKPGRGANFIVRPRPQNCLAMPLFWATHTYNPSL